MRKELETAYAADSDMTFIIENTYDEDDEILKIEVVGFYFGEPDEEATKMYADRNLRLEK